MDSSILTPLPQTPESDFFTPENTLSLLLGPPEEFQRQKNKIPIVSIVGPIGAGKSTILRALSAKMKERENAQFLLVPEPIDSFKNASGLGNPFHVYYNLMMHKGDYEPSSLLFERDCAFSALFQLYVLSCRVNSVFDAIQNNHNARIMCCERLALADSVFSVMMAESGIMTHLHFGMYIQAFKAAMKLRPMIPDMTIFIDTPPHEACDRVKLRNRNDEVVPYDYNVKLYDRTRDTFGVLSRDYGFNVVTLDGFGSAGLFEKVGSRSQKTSSC